MYTSSCGSLYNVFELTETWRAACLRDEIDNTDGISPSSLSVWVPPLLASAGELPSLSLLRDQIRRQLLFLVRLNGR